MNDERKNEINDVAPTSLKHLVGQRSVVDQVAVALDAAQMDGMSFPCSLLVGPPGCGKSALAGIVSQEMATSFHEVLGQSLKHPSDLNALLLAAKERDVLHVDEAHELAKPMQTSLYLALDKRRLVLGGQGGKSPQTLPLADFTVLLSTTDEYGLLQPLRDRCRLVLRFEFYSVEELNTVLHQRARALGWDIHEELFPLIARRARGTPRLALRLLQACWRVCRSVGEQTITLHHLNRACGLEQIDDLGLGPTEQKYLAALADGVTRLNVIASMLGLPSRTVSEVVEPFLLRGGFMVKDDQARRQLTAAGRECVSNLRADGG
jgi:Holliday junction DNA helicase RuvB